VKDGWTEVTFGELFDISSSKRVHQCDWKSSGVPFYRAREIVKLAEQGYVDNDLFISEEMYTHYRTKYGVPNPGDLMVSAVGTLGACYVVQPDDRFYYKDASVLRFSPKRPVCSQYVRYAFLTREIVDQVQSGAGSTVGTYTIERAVRTRIPLPPLSEQRRIAKILDKANALRAKRRVASSQSNALAQSTFIEMFGTPVEARRWERVPLSYACEKITDGTHHSPSTREVGVPYVTAKHLREEGLDFFADPWFVDEGDHREIFSRCDPRPGDVLYIKDGATTGIAAVNQYDFEFSMLSSVALLRPAGDQLTAEFLCCWLNSASVRRQILGAMAGAGIRRLTLAKIKSIEIPLPPVELQREFSRRVVAIDRLRLSVRTHLAKADALFASLLSDVVRGGVCA
jgi:type I restriction enzyme, S subunit